MHTHQPKALQHISEQQSSRPKLRTTKTIEMKKAADMLAALAPNAIKDAFRESMRDIRKVWDEQLLEARRKLESKTPERQTHEPQKEQRR